MKEGYYEPYLHLLLDMLVKFRQDVNPLHLVSFGDTYK